MSKPVSVPNYLNAVVLAGMALATGAVFLMSYPAVSSTQFVEVPTHATAPDSKLRLSPGKAEMPISQPNNTAMSSFEKFNSRMKLVMDTIDEWTPPAVFKKLF